MSKIRMAMPYPLESPLCPECNADQWMEYGSYAVSVTHKGDHWEWTDTPISTDASIIECQDCGFVYALK